ncbi:FliO/MopB family protein [Frigoribacterium sp. 2-23]|uniref:FliO/MopB family protein n=1 Tax=Frigoribacterium sp. 2-23 TaxID=3415006 RepID=UPI003C6F5C34
MDTVVVALRVVLSLGVVLALLWVLQKRFAKGLRSGRAASPVTVVSRQGIGTKASVVVVDVEGERLVLGVTDASITVLAAADAPVATPTLELVPSPAAPADPFARTLAAVQTERPQPKRHDAFAQSAVETSTGRDTSFGVGVGVGVGDGGAAAGTPTLRPRGAARRAALAPRARKNPVAQVAPRSNGVLPPQRGSGRRAVGTRRTAKAIEGSILAPDTWRQAAAAIRSGRAG